MDVILAISYFHASDRNLFSFFQVRRAVVQGEETMVKDTMMTGQAMGRTHLPTTSPHVTPPPTPPSLLVSEKETSGIKTRESNLQQVSSPPPRFLCCFYLSWPLSPPCGDSCVWQSGGEGKFCWNLKHNMKKKYLIWLHQQERDRTG